MEPFPETSALLRRTITAHLSDDEHAYLWPPVNGSTWTRSPGTCGCPRPRPVPHRIDHRRLPLRGGAHRQVRRADWAALVRTRWSLESGLDFEPTAHRRAGRDSALRFPQAHLGKALYSEYQQPGEFLARVASNSCQMRRGSGVPQGVPRCFPGFTRRMKWRKLKSAEEPLRPVGAREPAATADDQRRRSGTDFG